MELTSHIGEQPETKDKDHKPVVKAQKHNNAKVEQNIDSETKKLDNKDE
jgi:hypothetical protein